MAGSWCRDAHRRPQRRRPDAGDRRPRRRRPAPGAIRGAARASRGSTPAFPAVTCTAQTDYLTGRLPHRRTASSATAGTRARTPRSSSGSSRTSSCRRRRSGRRRARSTRRSRAPTCSGGTTCTPRRTTRSRRGRCTRPTAGSFPTSTPRRPICATSCSSELGHVPALRLLGTAGRRFARRAGLPTSAKHVERAVLADADARLPAASRLQPAARRSRRRRRRQRTSGRSTRSAAI